MEGIGLRFLKSAVVLIFIISGGAANAVSPPAAGKGVLDLSRWNFGKDGTVKISDGSAEGFEPAYYDKANDSAEYYLTIILPGNIDKSIQPGGLAISIPPILSPYYFWINDNIELSNGYNYIARWKVNYYDKSNILAVPGKLNRLKLYLKIFNYSNIKLIREPLSIGQESDLREQRWGVLFREGIIDGALFLIFIFTFLLWIGNRKNPGFLIIGLFAFFQALNLIGKGETLNFLSEVSSDTLIKIQIILNYVKLSLINLLFINMFFYNFKKAAFRSISAFFILFLTCMILPLSLEFLNYVLMAYYILLFASLSFFIIVSAYFIKKDRRKSFTSLFGTSILLLSYLIYAIQNKLYIFSLSVIFVGAQDNLAYGILFFVITNTYYLYITSSKAKTEAVKEPVIDEFASKYNLSNRERDILILLVQRYSYKEIANSLFISNKTVETHIYHIYQKTGSKNKTELIEMVQIQ